MNKLFLVIISLTLMLTSAKSQTTHQILTLEQAIQIAQEKSPDFQKAITSAENSYWRYRTYRTTLLPKIGLQATLPQYSDQVSRVLQPDGSYALRNSTNFYNDIRLSVDQNVPFTGGLFSVSSSLNRNQTIAPENAAETEFYSVPFSFNYSQPMLLYNRIKWDRKIQPLLYQEALKKYAADFEQIRIQTANFYFNAINAQVSQEIAKVNYSNSDTLYKIAEGRYNLGKIAENDLLQMELNLLNAENDLYQANIASQDALQNLKRYLGIDQTQDLVLNVPSEVPHLLIDLNVALQEAYANKQEVLSFKRRELEAEQQIASARGQSGYNINVQGNFGVSYVGSEISQAYTGVPAQQQYLGLGLSIPLVDWGAAKSRVRQAKSNRDLIMVDLEQEKINFEQNIKLEVKNFHSQKLQLKLAAKADTISQKRYDVTKNRYLTGKISITDLNLAQNEMSQAKQRYMTVLRNYWNSYYNIRVLTLYDFEQNEKIKYTYEKK